MNTELMTKESVVANNAGLIWLLVVIFIVIYLIDSISHYILAKQAGHSSPIMAFIPIANQVQFMNIAGYSGWLILLAFVPIVNFFAAFFFVYVSYKYYTGFEGGGIVFAILVICSLIGAFIPHVMIGSLLAVLVFAFTKPEYYGDLYYC